MNSLKNIKSSLLVEGNIWLLIRCNGQWKKRKINWCHLNYSVGFEWFEPVDLKIYSYLEPKDNFCYATSLVNLFCLRCFKFSYLTFEWGIFRLSLKQNSEWYAIQNSNIEDNRPKLIENILKIKYTPKLRVMSWCG